LRKQKSAASDLVKSGRIARHPPLNIICIAPHALAECRRRFWLSASVQTKGGFIMGTVRFVLRAIRVKSFANIHTLCVSLAILVAAPALAADDFAKWRHFVPIRFDTSATGAEISGDVKNFPVAVALDATNFDFSQAKPDGADVRFSSTENSGPLAHSIEHWDAAAKSGLVWVKVPEIKGNSAEQFIVMHWSNPEAANASDSAKVFSTDDGFVGVWHLNESATNDDGGYKDATANAAHGTGVNLQPGVTGKGPLGNALKLEHARTQWVKVDSDKRKLFDLTNKITFSIWVKANSFANKEAEGRKGLPGYETMFAKGDNSWRLQKFGIKSWHKPPRELIEICVEKAPRADLCTVGKTDMALDTWYHFVGVQDHPHTRLYVNGVLDVEQPFDVEWVSGDHPVGIGNQSQFPQQGRSWDGTLDEARVLNTPKDANWIKLDYESQREGQKFSKFGKPQRRAG
jgi:hypothetical protein